MSEKLLPVPKNDIKVLALIFPLSCNFLNICSHKLERQVCISVIYPCFCYKK
jgi:hypothetical protein